MEDVFDKIDSKNQDRTILSYENKLAKTENFCWKIVYLGLFVYFLSHFLSPGIYRGGLNGQGRIDGNYYYVNIKFKSESHTRWKWVWFEGNYYQEVSMSFSGNNDIEYIKQDIVIEFPSLICRYNGNEKHFSKEVLNEILATHEWQMEDENYLQATDELYDLILSFGDGTLPVSYHHSLGLDGLISGSYYNSNLQGFNILIPLSLTMVFSSALLCGCFVYRYRNLGLIDQYGRPITKLSIYTVLIIMLSTLQIICILVLSFSTEYFATISNILWLSLFPGAVMVLYAVLLAFIRTFNKNIKSIDFIGVVLTVFCVIICYHVIFRLIVL